MTETSAREQRVPGAVAERARAALGSLPRGEARAVQALLAQGSDVIRVSVSEIAAAAGTGVGTVVRACQSLGFKGFQDAKIALTQDLAPLVGERSPEHIDRGDRPAEVLAKLAASSAEALSRTPVSVDGEALARAVELLRAAPRVLLLGVGTSSPLTQDMAYRLLTIGISAEAPSDVHVQHVRARLLRQGDVAVAVSHTGSTRETVNAARGAHEAGASVVAVTSFSTTPLTEIADVALVAGGLETRYRVEAMTSRLAHLVVLDSLLISLVLAEPERSETAQKLLADVLAEHRF
ncbi:MurR/RpiR family transcriptional regulator [Amycolatopsis acidicola]|uniref:MurR/RpiR family transcriptional regulator n=1 Tax=Amycolatopsis acidicola TaxID=2596893 RepID=UPI001FB64FAD|nr:MurR/RpiR family transcriptional regulator [Amycolatopsis acidicola]